MQNKLSSLKKYSVACAMERYCTSFDQDVATWENTIKTVDPLPFECVYLLGHGEHCSVHTIIPAHLGDEESEYDSSTASETPEVHWTEDYFNLNDVDGSFSELSEEDVSSDTWSVETGSDTSRSDTSTHVPLTIITPSPMGPVEVVAKRFLNVNDDICYQACRPDTEEQLTLKGDSRSFIKWLEECREPVATHVLTTRVSATEACYSGFVSESLCHLLITDLVACGLTPHITMAFRALRCGNTGYLVQERISGTLEEILESDATLGAPQVAALYFQILVTMHILQTACQLKHHDLHTDNVFVRVIDENLVWKDQRLKDATHFEYCLDDTTSIYLPNSGYIVKIGDFGMASLNVYGRRIQRLDMETYGSSMGWGDWNATFEGYEGYDVQMLMGAPPFDDTSSRVEDTALASFLRHVRRVAQGPTGKLTRSHLRPMAGHVSRVSPLEVLRQVFVQEPGPDYNFTVAPTHGCNVINLGDLRQLSTHPPLECRKRKHQSGQAGKK